MRPWLKIRYTKPITEVHLIVPLGRGQYQTFSARVDNSIIRQALLRAGVALEVGFSLGGLWKKIKKVGKAIGVDKVLKLGKAVLNNPILNTVLPVTKLAGTALTAATGLLAAKKAAAKGDPRAKQILAATHKLAAGGNAQAKAGLAMASRLYQIQVTPL